jgi:hypothetical protein
MESIAGNQDGPRAFILALDGEFSGTKLENDQVWSLCLDASDTSPFYLQTTYHLRAKSMRLFPNIIFGHQRLTNPNDFTLPPTVTNYTPSTLTIKFGLINYINIRFDCFIPESESLVGTVEINNTGTEPVELDCEMGTVLIPMGKGSPTHPKKIGSNQILSGQTEDLYPVLFMSSGPTATSNPYPALCVSLNIAPGESTRLHWALVSKKSLETSLKTARKLSAPTWHKTSQQLIKSHARQRVHIKTGDPDWDLAFFLAQVNALTHLIDMDSNDNKPVFVRTRLPDQLVYLGHEKETLCDLTLLDVLHLTEVLLPPYVEHLTGLVEGFVSRVDNHGCLSSHILRGLNGMPVNECPLLASLCLALFEITQDHAFLRRVFPHLERFFVKGWLGDEDLAGGIFPSWETPAQLQLDMGLFNFDIWEATGKGLDIRTAESPALAAMLHRESIALQTIAHILGHRAARAHFSKTTKALSAKILTLWDDDQKCFTYKDHQSHLSLPRELYFPGLIKEKIEIDKHFTDPQRLLIHITTNDERTRACVVHILGRDSSGETILEQFRTPEMRWVLGRAHLTTQHLYSTIDQVTFEGFNPDDRFLIETADYSQVDISCLLPLWSNLKNKDLLTELVENQLDWDSPDFAAGIPETWRCAHPLPEGLTQQVNSQWNTLIIDGLIRVGFTEEATTAFIKLMSTTIKGLKSYHGFFSAYEVDQGLPKGHANAINGLAPVGLFLKLAGVKLFSPNKVAIWGSNPFPWPIQVDWQGLWIRREGAQTHIIFPDGTQYQSQATKPLVVKSGQG